MSAEEVKLESGKELKDPVVITAQAAQETGIRKGIERVIFSAPNESYYGLESGKELKESYMNPKSLGGYGASGIRKGIERLVGR